MLLPNQMPPVRVKPSIAQYLSLTSSKYIFPSQRSIPSPIKIALVELGKTILDFDGNFLCASAIYSTLNNYDTCLGRPGNTERGCALEAARFIAGPLCDTYCSSLCQSK
jgi:hypothetical protein